MKRIGTAGIEITLGVGEAIRVEMPQDKPLLPGDKVVFSIREDIDSDKLVNVEVTAFDENGGALIPLTPEVTAPLEEGSYVYGINIVRKNADPVALIRNERLKAKGAVASDG